MTRPHGGGVSLAVRDIRHYLRHMTIRKILEVPDPVLKQVSKPVETFDDELKALVADMFETMYDAPGIGLAAIQVGVPLRVLVIDLQPEDLDGNVHEETMEGLMATCLQHEMDHLEGILFIDHLSRLKRNMALKKLEKLRKAA